ncbi:hypothetical protein POM88_035783 [Heracleum sosnowskyi]|uniref:Uncharacterized protein n=1 Tax=Heracleum sosnowskyi TaxID=360622 RepID=A0AAD8MDL1_9APIA|nr:hypothetical protein POM88_035783 [Heracleum sosnowskyi]
MEHNTERQQLSSEPVIPTADQLSWLYVEWRLHIKRLPIAYELHLLESASTPRKGAKLSQAAAALHEFKSLSAGKGITQNNVYLIGWFMWMFLNNLSNVLVTAPLFLYLIAFVIFMS